MRKYRPSPARRPGRPVALRPQPLERRVMLCGAEWLGEAAAPPDDPSIGDSPVATVAGPADAHAAGAVFTGDPLPGPGVPMPPLPDWTMGTKRILYVRVTFADKPGYSPQTLASARASMNFCDAFVRANSYGQTRFDATITDVVVLPKPESYYSSNFPQLRTDALAAAKALNPGWNADKYDLDAVRYDGGPALNDNSPAFAFINSRGTWLRTDVAEAAMHEFGHNLGLNHANFWQPAAPDAPASAGTNYEYGNPFDVMGNGGTAGQAGNFNAYEKNFLGWLPDSAVETVDHSGTYTVYPADSVAPPAAGQAYALKVAKDGTRDYWLSSRGDPYWARVPSLNGLEVDWGAWSKDAGANSDRGSQLLDMTPQSAADRYDYGLPLGHTFGDASAGIHITPLARDAAGAVTVSIQFDGDQPAPDAGAPDVPRISAGPGGTVGTSADDAAFPLPVVNASAGRPLTLTATSNDGDGDVLSYAWDFGASAAGGSLGPGGLMTSTGEVADAPAAALQYDTPGVYRARLTVSDLRGGSSSASVLVRVTGPATSGAPGPGAAPAQNVITGRVRDAFGRPLPQVRVSDGDRWTYTDSDGTYALAALDDAPRTLAASRPDGWSIEPAGFANPVAPGPVTRGDDFRATPTPFYVVGSISTGAGYTVENVVVSDGRQTTLTDSLGRFALPEPNGTYDLTFNKPGYPTSAARGVVVDDANVFVTASAAGGSVAGSVRGIPPGMTVTVTWGGGHGEVASGGYFRFEDVPQGSWTLSAVGRDEDGRLYHLSPAGWQNPLLVDGAQYGIDFELTRPGTYSVTGRVTALGEGVAGAAVTFKVPRRHDDVTTVYADDDGYYAADALPGATYLVSAAEAGYVFGPLIRRLDLRADRDAIDFHGPDVPPDDRPPALLRAPTASPALVRGVSTWLDADATDDFDADRLTYSWGVQSAPDGGVVSFSDNGDNVASHSLATFSRAGVYRLTLTVNDLHGGATESELTVSVVPVLNSVRVDTQHAVLAPGTVRRFRAVALDQFGMPLAVATPVTWRAVGAAGTVTPDGRFTAGGVPSEAPGALVATVSGIAGGYVAGSATVQVKPYSAVTGRYVFYNDSAYDGDNAGPDVNDDQAVAADKRALLPGDGPATAANYTGFAAGITGVMVDFDGLWGRGLSADDFVFEVGAGSGAGPLAGDWSPAPRPASVTLRPVVVHGGALQRATLIWADDVPRNEWLRVTVLPTQATGLAARDVFYFGNLAGDTGDAPPGATAARVDSLDVAATLRHTGRSSGDLTTPFDHDGDTYVSPGDAAAARRNQGAWLALINGIGAVSWSRTATHSIAKRVRPQGPDQPMEVLR